MSNQNNAPAKNGQPTIEQKVHQLDEQVEWFYGDDFTLDQALTNYEKTTKLANEIEQDLTELKNKVEVIADLTR